jgi:phage host-nuclease inhibitor protein Gam
VVTVEDQHYEAASAANKYARDLRRIRREIANLEHEVREQAHTTRDRYLEDVADDLKRIADFEPEAT